MLKEARNLEIKGVVFSFIGLSTGTSVREIGCNFTAQVARLHINPGMDLK
jgi:hypothetical protein